MRNHKNLPRDLLEEMRIINLEVTEIVRIFAGKTHINKKGMCTVTLEYNQSNALAWRKLAALLATGLFQKVGETPDEAYNPTPEEVGAHRKLRDALLEHSRKTMSPIIARYL